MVFLIYLLVTQFSNGLIQDSINAPYKPCQLLYKIIPTTVAGFLFNRKCDDNSLEQSSSIKNVDKDETLLPTCAKEDVTIPTIPTQKYSISRPSKHAKGTEIAQNCKGYVFIR